MQHVVNLICRSSYRVLRSLILLIAFYYLYPPAAPSTSTTKILINFSPMLVDAYLHHHYNRCQNKYREKRYLFGCNRNLKSVCLSLSIDENENNDFDVDDDDDRAPEVNVEDFDQDKFLSGSNIPTYGLTGRSSPHQAQRKAIGKGSKDRASIYICTNCSSEFVKWVGRCPTCKSWNTVQEFSVRRSAVSDRARPKFA